ncbi:major royal jelly protein 3-like [Leptopilina heterotoma]|uniref:major royal jelly protein 3-like n=1 Tax=Leptopilina heterotoma TaxID=63436 RepID=UPI001CA7FB1C|nr:major royal jelly protein 3-like [Leptopilina heterotoma]
MNARFHILALLILFLSRLSNQQKQLKGKTKLQDVYNWQYVDFEYDSQERKDQILKNGNYSKTSILIKEFYLVEDGRTFVVLNKNDKSPVTLATISNKTAPNGPLLKPYPNWQWHLKHDCIGIYRARTIQTDPCNKNWLWVLDNGQNDEGIHMCQPQLLIFDLSANRLISRYSIPKKFATGSDGKGELLGFIVQTSGRSCRTTTIYMSYLKSSALLVWNGRKFWRIKGPDPKFMVGPLAVGKRYMDAPIGIYGFTLSPKTDKTPQFLAMSSLGSFHVFTATIDDIIASEPKVGFFK